MQRPQLCSACTVNRVVRSSHCCLVILFLLTSSGCGSREDGSDASALRDSDSSSAVTTRIAGDTSRFDSQDIDNALRWWIATVRELGEAQGSGNQLRVDAALQEFNGRLASLRGQRIRYPFSVRTPSVGGALATGQAISREGVHIGIQHETDHGAIRIGSRVDATGRPHSESTPILLRTGQGIDEAMLMQLSTRSTLVASATITDVTWLGSTFMRPPTLVLFVDDVQVEQIKP